MGLAWSALLALAVTLPWLQPGFIFATDWPGQRIFPFPPQVGSSWPLRAALAAVGTPLGGEATGKLFIILVLFGVAFAAYRCLPAGGSLPRAGAAAIYLFNPFVYDRVQYGQFFLLAGYALLPLVALWLRTLLVEPTIRRAIKLGAALTLLGILDLHLLLPAGLLVGVSVLAFLPVSGDWKHRLAVLKGAAVAVVAGLVSSAWWLVPFVVQGGRQSQLLSRITSADVLAFRSVSDPAVGIWPNVLGLYGFFGERTGYYASMKAFVPFWAVILALMLVFVALGAVGVWRGLVRFDGAGRWVAAVVAAALVAWVLAVGTSDPRLAPIVSWLNGHVPAFKGMRESGKWTALLALAYAQLFPLGFLTVHALLSRFAASGPRDGTDSAEAGRRGLAAPVARALSALLALAVVAIPIYYGNGMLLGTRGQIKPSQYPPGWYQVDSLLKADPQPGRTVFFPWIYYSQYSFVDNRNSLIVSPAPTFFQVPVASSHDIHIAGDKPLDDPDEKLIDSMLQESDTNNWAKRLANHDFKYVILARERFGSVYQTLDTQPDLTLVGDYEDLILYRNDLWKPG